MHLFYTPDINADLYQLNEEESKHCTRVLRLVNGDIIFLVDGQGGFFETKIIDNHPKRCMVQVVDVKREFQKRKNYLHIAIAPTKNIERTEWFLEKATEVGIDEITLLLCDHSERKEIKPERLNKIIESAMKQSLKAYHPKLNGMLSFNHFIAQKFDHENRMIAHCLETSKKTIAEIKKESNNSRNLILIGPEGDFSNNEIELAIKNNFNAITLGESRLRTETAALMATILADQDF